MLRPKAGTPPLSNSDNNNPSEEDHNETYENIEDTYEYSENISKVDHDIKLDVSEKGGSVPQEPSKPSPPSPYADTEEKFWLVYQKLLEKERSNPSNHMSVDKDTVSKADLISSLYDSGQFSITEANESFAKAVKSGRTKGGFI